MVISVNINIKKILIFLIVFCITAVVTAASLTTMFKRPHFSIIISAYNYGHYLPDVIDSILNSTYRNYEVIIVNDGSTDNTYTIMQAYAKKDGRIKLINQKNQGLSVARNNAMKIAKGEYFWFVDADDYIDKVAMSNLQNAIAQSAWANNGKMPDIVSFYIENFTDDGKKFDDGYTRVPPELLKYESQQYDGSELSAYTLFRFPVTSGKQIYRARYLKDKNIHFVPRLVFEDDCFFLTTVTSGAKGIIIPKVLYYKRAHRQSIVANRYKYYDSTVNLPRVIYESLKAHNANEEIANLVFNFYISGIYGKWPDDPKYISDLEKLLKFIEKQPTAEPWLSHAMKLRAFIQEQKTNFQINR